MKYRLGILLLTFIFITLTGCGKDIELTIENVDSSTIAIREDNTLQVALIDSFDQEYYDIEEFKSFIDKEINKYNNQHGEGAIILDALEKQEDNVILILTYGSISHYTEFNGVEGHLSGTKLAGDFTLPESFLTPKGDSVTVTQALEKDDYEIFAINEDIKILIDGKIVYYHNGEYIDSQTLQADDEEMTYIIFKDKLF
ncbi:MAG: hypothetical protein GX995_01865 [Clostridiales bacterium]|nr:hypothetical protein [Clostridiales bacterium]